VGDIFPVTLELKLVGIYDDPEKTEALLFSQEYLRESMTGGRRDMVGSWSVQAENKDVVARVAADIDKTFENAPQPTKTEAERAFVLSFVSFIGNVKVFLLVYLRGGDVHHPAGVREHHGYDGRERIREVGILKTLGYRNGIILGLILGEAAFIALLGGVAGLVLASGIAYVLRQGPAVIDQIRTLTISPPVALFCLAFSVLIGVVSSLIPAIGAARTNILDAIRNEG
jgi:putative ABC transport system permease protein